MKTGNGKIANLPAEIREELNYRLNDGDEGTELVEWLNAKPEVMKVINDLFDGRPISEQNLSQWRTHGYRVWHAHRTIVDETHALSDNSEGIAETGIDCEKLLLALTASYAEMIQRWIITPGEEMLHKLRVFKEITNGVLALRRAELQKARLEIQRERLELLREKQRNKSASSSSAPASSSAECANAAADSEPNDQSKARNAVPSHTPASRSSSSATPPASPECELPISQPPPPMDSLPAPKPALVESPLSPPEPAPHPNEPKPPASAPAMPQSARPAPAYRDPRSCYSLQ